jgi:hypothetical protein
MQGLMGRNRRRGWGMHTITFCPICLEHDGTEDVQVEATNGDQTLAWRRNNFSRCALSTTKSSKNGPANWASQYGREVVVAGADMVPSPLRAADDQKSDVTKS